MAELHGVLDFSGRSPIERSCDLTWGFKETEVLRVICRAVRQGGKCVRMQAGITNAALASAAVQMTNVLMTVVAASLMDRAGRKQLLTLSFSGMGLSMLAMAAGLGLKQLSGLSSTVAIVGTVAYVVSFALGAGPVPGLLVPEITPARLRGARSLTDPAAPTCCLAATPMITAVKV